MSTAERIPPAITDAPGHPRVSPLITTKLGVPLLPPAYRPRARIEVHLDRSLADATRLTLLSAPPGYGKSVAVAGWLAARAVPHAWLSLDAGDNDPARFLRYLVAAFASVRPSFGDEADALGEAAADADLEFVGATLIDALAGSDDPFVLVLDDYHAISAGPVHELVGLLLAHGPPFAHVVVVTREDPPFPLARLRAHGRLVELRADELRYTEDEARRHFIEVAGLDLQEVDVTRLLERTEGWIAGVQLAAISLQGSPDVHAQVDAFAGTQRFVLDYLAAEVVGSLDTDLRGFLVRISVAERFTVELCRALSGRVDSVALLERAERLNLFVIPLDPTRRWYQFHHLFADYLRTLLDESERRALHERAADWFEATGLTGEAIEHALAAGATDRAIGLVEGVARATYGAGEMTTLLRWLDALPPERIAASQELIAVRAHAAFQTGRVAEAEQACRDGEAARAGGAASGPLLTVRALVAAFSNRPEAVELGQSALEALRDDPFYRARALSALASAYLSAGDLHRAGETARAALDMEAGSRHSSLVVPAATGLATSLNYLGHRRDAEALCREVLANHRAEVGRMAGGTPYALYWLGMVLYEANDLAEAADALERGWAAAGTFGFGRAMFTKAVSYLALARHATGSAKGALEAIRTVRRDARAAGLEGIEPGLAQIEARLQLMQGDLGAAGRWADAVEHADREGHGHPAEGPATGRRRGPGWPDERLTQARVRLAQRRPHDARRLLAEASRIAVSAGNAADLITVRVLEAATAELSGSRSEAQRTLEEAIGLAAPEGYVRRVVDDGNLVVHLLPAVRRVAPAFVDEATAALAGTPVPGPGRTQQAGPSLWRGEDGRPFEALTARELEVLQLMARGSSDAAIANALVVSLATAKWHAAHIRAKLGATSRTQAILRAQELGLV